MGERRKAARRMVGGLLAATVATALMLPAGGPAGAEPADDFESMPAPTWTYSPDEPMNDGDIAARATGEGVSRQEAERRLRADRAASHLQDEARARWPDTFAGLWIDHAPYRVNVAFTRDAAANVTALAESFPYPDDLRAVDARHSFTALSLLQGRLAQERNALQHGQDVPGMAEPIRGTRGDYDLDIDVRSGRAVVRVARPSSRLRAAFAQRYGGPLVVMGGKAQPHTCRQVDCRYAMMGGLKLSLGYDDARGVCSSGFTAYLTSNSSYRYVLSAGHCYQNSGTTFRVNGGNLYGYTSAHRVSGEVDAERIRRDDTGPWRESSKFYVEGESYPRMVNSVTSYSSIVVGAYVGKTGYTTGTTRGYVTSKSVAPSYVPNGRNFVEGDLCSDQGDSGGAVWSGNTAYGIVSGGTPAYCRDINGTLGPPPRPFAGRAIFGALSYATAAMGVTILTGTNLRPTAEFTYECLLTDCTFDASASQDEDGGVTSWSWNFGDGSTGSGRKVTHSYVLPGLYTITLTTKDNNGSTASKSTGIAVTAS